MNEPPQTAERTRSSTMSTDGMWIGYPHPRRRANPILAASSHGGLVADRVEPGMRVSIVQKQDQLTGERTEGVVRDVLTRSPTHPHGIKVRLESGEVGRVKEILKN
jgi:uncharacterized repeat protein (TIGR03833 family)